MGKSRKKIKSRKLTPRVLITFVVLEFIIILGLLYALFLYDPGHVRQTASGCNVYDMDYVIKEYAKDQERSDEKQSFHLGDVYECVERNEPAIYLDPWGPQLLDMINESDELQYDTFEQAVADQRFGEPVYVATEDFTIIPLAGADSVTWICPEEITCQWDESALGHSLVLYYENGVPKVAGH